MLPIGPLQLWVWCRRRALGLSGAPDPSAIVAAWLGVHDDSVNRWLDRKSPVDEEFIDLVLTRSGRGSFEDAYPQAFLDAPSQARRVLVWVGMVLDAQEAVAGPVRRCGWGKGCGDLAVAGGRFCGSHGAVLAGIREQILREGSEMSRGGAVTLKAARRGKGARTLEPQCCALECMNPRLRGERFCFACQDAGMVEEEMFAA